MIILYLLLLVVVAAFSMGVSIGKTIQPTDLVDAETIMRKQFDEMFPNHIPEQKVWVEDEPLQEEETTESVSPVKATKETSSETPNSSLEASDDIIVPITVADDEYIAPPMAKSSIKYEDEPADDDDIIKDAGESSYYSELAKQQAQIEVA